MTVSCFEMRLSASPTSTPTCCFALRSTQATGCPRLSILNFRFYCDVERLIGDNLAGKGQGIIYSATDNGARRLLTKEEKEEIFCTYTVHISALQDKLTRGSLLIDCHSFPSDLAPDVDICIGYNEDWSKPADDMLRRIQEYLGSNGFKIYFNHPFRNSLTPPSAFCYKSVMLEVNKKVYLNKNDLSGQAGFDNAHFILPGLYEKLLMK